MKKLCILINCLSLGFASISSVYAQQQDDYWRSFVDKTVGRGNYYLYRQTMMTQFQDNTKHRALDLGAGAGDVSIRLAAKGWDVTAIDSSQRSGEVIKERSKNLPGVVTFQQKPFYKMKLEGNYDLVISMSALPFGDKDHLRSILRNVSMHMPAGAVFAANFFSEDSTYAQKKYAYGVTKSELLGLLKRNGFKVEYFLNRQYSELDFDNEDVKWDIYDVIAVKVRAN